MASERSGALTWLAIILILAAAGAMALRLPFLDQRPMHGDEANQAVKAGLLLDEGVYRYDPHDHHGPTLYYAALVSAWVSGADEFSGTAETTYRIVPVLFGVATIGLLWGLRGAIGGSGVVLAAVLMAVSPAMVYYSRYFIQETLLLFFTLAVLVALRRYLTTATVGAAVAVGLAAGLMHATKETCVIAFAGMMAGLVAYGPKLRAEWGAAETRGRWLKHFGLVVVSAVGISAVFYSSFFTYGRGILDSYLTYGNYLQRADGAGLHDKPWHYYLGLLGYVHRGPGPWWSEGFILLLAAVGAVAAILPRALPGTDKSFQRFLLVYGVVVTVFYSAIPYKTPWTVLTMLQVFVLLGGLGGAWLFSLARRRWAYAAVALFLAAGAVHLERQASAAIGEYRADPRNPYVYAHTSSAFMRLVERLDDLAAVAPEGREMVVRVIQPDGDYWPLPWYLRGFGNVGYYSAIPEDADAAVLIVSPRIKEAVDTHLDGDYFIEMQGLRPSVLRVVYIRRDLWDAFMAGRV